MPNGPLLVPGREQFLEMAAPARRVLAGAPASGGCIVEDGLDAPAHPRCGLGPHAPDRLQDAHDLARSDRRNRHRPERYHHVCFERGPPLLPVLRIAPARLMRLEVVVGDPSEGDPGGLGLGFRRRRSSLLLLRLRRMGAALDHRPERGVLSPRRGQRDRVWPTCAAEAKFAFLPVNLIPIDPERALGAADAKTETIPVPIRRRAGRQGFDLGGGEADSYPRHHGFPLLSPLHTSERTRMQANEYEGAEEKGGPGS